MLPVQPVAAAAWNPYPQTTTADQGMTYQINPSHSGSPGPQTLVPPLRPAWTIDLGGPVSYPLLGAYVFVTATNLTTNRPQLYAIDYHKGSIAWGPIDLGGIYWANASYDNGRLFTINSNGQMQAFDEQTGAVQWTTQLPGQSSFTSPPSGSTFGSNSDLVYTSGAGSGGTLYAVHEGSGAIAWQASVMNGDHSTPVVTNSGVYVSYACAQTYDFDPLTGALLWHHATNCEGGGGKTAVLNNGKLYVRDAIVGNSVLDASTGASLGTFGATVAPAFSGTTGFFLNGTTLRAVDLNTNSVLWSFTGDGALSTAPIVVNGTVYIGSTSGTLFGVDATAGTSSWSASLGAPIKAPDEQNASAPLAGLSAGGGYLAAPAGNTLTLFGSALQVVPGSVNFGVKTLGSSTLTPVWVGNNFAGALTITSVAASGDYSASSSCPVPVNPGQACQITVTFTPSALGPRNGTLTITDSAPGSPHLVSLIGGATDGVIDHFALTPPGATVAAGTTQAYGAEAYDAFGQDAGDYSNRVTFAINQVGCTANVCNSGTKAGSQQVTALFTAQAKAVGGATTLNVLAGPLDHITLAPATAVLTAGAVQAYSTEAFDQYGNDLGSATAATTFSIGPDGSCAAAACSATLVGPHTITAADSGKTATGSLSVTAGPIDHITISPTSSSVAAGSSQAYTTESFDQYGNDLGSATSASAFRISPDGSCTGTQCSATIVGAHTVTALASGLTATATLNVTAGPVAKLAISPASATITAGGTASYTVRAVDQYGNSIGDVTAATTFAITPDGSCTGATCGATKAGPHTVTANDNGASTTASLTVVGGSIDHIGLTPAAATIVAGASQAYVVESFDQFGNDLGPNGAATLGISPDGSCTATSCTATAAGVHTVTAVNGSTSASATLTVKPGSAASLAITPVSFSISADTNMAYTTVASDQYGNSLGEVTAGTTFGISPNGTCTGRFCGSTVTGTHTVVATYQGVTAAGTLTVTPGQAARLALNPSSATIVAGSSQTYTAVGYDQYGNSYGDVTSTTTFYLESSLGPACKGNVCSSTVAGPHQVVGEWNTIGGSSPLTVTAGPATTLAITPASLTLVVGDRSPMTATAADAYGNATTLPGVASWSVSTGTPGTVGPTTGNATTFTSSAKVAGSGTVSAHAGALTAQVAVHVLPGTPTGLRASSPSSRKVTLNWTAATADLTFAVYREVGTSGWTLVKSGLTSTSFSDTGLTSGTTYSYYVTGWAHGSESYGSTPITITAK